MPQKKTLEKYAQKPPPVRVERSPEEERRADIQLAQLLSVALGMQMRLNQPEPKPKTLDELRRELGLEDRS